MAAIRVKIAAFNQIKAMQQAVTVVATSFVIYTISSFQSTRFSQKSETKVAPEVCKLK